MKRLLTVSALARWCAALLLFAGSAVAATVATVSSPGHFLTVTLGLNGEGRPEYSVARNGKPVIAESRLGFLLTDAPKLERNFALAAQSTRSVDEIWEQPWGERRYVRNQFNELRVRLTEKTPLARSLDVVFRVYDDGLGFRYEFPDQAQLRQVNIAEELTEFAVVDPATAWWIPAGEWNRYEYLYNTTPLAELSQAHTPVTIRTEAGLHIAFHEAALVDYSSMWLRRVTGQRLKANLSPSSQGPKVSRTAPFVTPWRTMQIADSAGGLYMSDLILNLNEPNKLGDVSWFKPMKYVGIWWAMHLDTWSWASGPKHGATTEHAKRYIDFAAKNGFGGVLIEGWNLGWDGDWFANGETFSFTQAYPDFDIAAVAAYAHKKGVRIIGHHETSANIAHYEEQLGAGLDLYTRLGIDGVKTGYVADAGGVKALGEDGKIHFEWHDGQVMSRHHLKVVTEAAKRHIAVDAHEPIKDTGLRRTYPNWVSREGARGMEYNAWGNPPNPPEHEANLIFTRMLAGPMDFTPGVLSLTGRGGQPLQSTMAKQLANYVVIYSPVQMAADLPENYARYPGPFQFIKDVPADWSDTRVLNGEVGDYATIVRKDRNSDDWYLGSVTDENARTIEVSLDFLDAGRSYTAQVYRDGDDADWKTNRYSIAIEKRMVKQADKLTLRLAPGGGEAIRFVAARSPSALPARTTPVSLHRDRFVNYENFPSRNVTPRKVVVWLPEGYDGGRDRYAVLYMHDGQNLFDPETSTAHEPWAVDRHLAALERAGAVRRTIIVGIANSAARWREYAPAAAVERLDPQLRTQVAEAGGGDPQSEAYLQFLVEELKPFMGGLISLYALARYPDVFGGAGCLSTHWVLTTNPTLLGPPIDARVESIGGAYIEWLAGHLPPPKTHRIYFDHGTVFLDALYGPFQERVDRLMAAQGYQRGIDLESRVFPGATHNEQAWRDRLDIPLTYLLRR